MSKKLLLSSSIAIAALITSPAYAGSTRSGHALPKVATSSSHASHALPQHVGPKKGWPDNNGIKNAWEHSNEHSAHHRHDSEG